jgi:hypothetical protein
MEMEMEMEMTNERHNDFTDVGSALIQHFPQ